MTAGSHYSDQQRRQAVVLYLLHGNWKHVSELTGIPQRTLNDWALQPWFGTLLAELRAKKAAELEGVYTRIIDEATTQLLDRVRNGDPHVVGGEVKRKPVSARDLALVAAITFDKRALVRNQPEATPQPNHTLQELAEWLAWKTEQKIAREGVGRGGKTLTTEFVAISPVRNSAYRKRVPLTLAAWGCARNPYATKTVAPTHKT